MAGLRDGISSGGGGGSWTTGAFTGDVDLGDASGDSVTITGTLDTDMLVGTDKKIQFRDTGIYINSGANGKLSIVADGGGADDITLSGGITTDGSITMGAGEGFASAVRMATTSKIEFHDAGLYIQSSADGKLKLASDGSGADDITLSGTITLDDDITTGAGKGFASACRMATTSKVEFYDAGCFIHAASDGKIVISADGTSTDDITLSGTVTCDADFAYSGHKDAQILCIAGNLGLDDAASADWLASADGLFLTASKTSALAYFPISGLKVGDEIVGYRIHGRVESAANAVTVDAKLTKVLNDGTNTDVTNGAITQVSETTNANFDEDEAVAITAETIVANTMYHIIVDGTTGASTAIYVTGLEIDINRK